MSTISPVLVEVSAAELTPPIAWYLMWSPTCRVTLLSNRVCLHLKRVNYLVLVHHCIYGQWNFGERAEESTPFSHRLDLHTCSEELQILIHRRWRRGMTICWRCWIMSRLRLCSCTDIYHNWAENKSSLSLDFVLWQGNDTPHRVAKVPEGLSFGEEDRITTRREEHPWSKNITYGPKRKITIQK